MFNCFQSGCIIDVNNSDALGHIGFLAGQRGAVIYYVKGARVTISAPADRVGLCHAKPISKEANCIVHHFMAVYQASKTYIEFDWVFQSDIDYLISLHLVSFMNCSYVLLIN